MIRSAACLGGVFALLAVIHLSAGSLAWTGDEIGYAYNGLGIYENHAYYPTLQQWNGFLKLSGVGFSYDGPVQKPHNSLGPSIVYGPVLEHFGLEPARWFSFAMGCAGLALLYYLLAIPAAERKRVGFDLVAIASVALVAFALPLLAYLQLMYAEALLFLVVSAALFALLRRKTVAAVALIALLPWVHIRALPMMLVFFALLLADSYRQTSLRERLVVIAAVCAAIGAFAAFQIHVFGSMTGGAFSTRPPSWNSVPERLGMQLFDVRHGLLAYSPVFLFGFAGLAYGAVRRKREALYSAALLIVYIATFMWSNAGESWTARFWVAGLPFLAVGVCAFLRALPNRRWAFILVPALLITWFNTYLFATQPMAFLSSRRLSVPYTLLNSWTHLHLGLYLPLDADPGTLETFTRTIPVLLIFAFLTVGALAVTAAASGAARRAASIAAIILLVLPYVACAVNSLPASAYRASPGGNGVTITFAQPTRVTALQLNGTLDTNWFAPDVPRFFKIICRSAAGVRSLEQTPSRPLDLLDGCSDTTSVTIEALAPTSESFYKKMVDVEALRAIF